MKVVPGTKQFDGSITADTMSLNDAMLLRPEISNKVVELFKNQCSLTAFLQSRGKTKKDIGNSDTFKIDNVYGNTKIMWPLIGYPEKLVHQTRAVTVGGSTPANGTQVGLAQAEFEIYIDDPYFNPGDIVTLEDRFKQIYIKTEPFPIAPGEWRYTAVINGNNLTNYILYDASTPSTGLLLGIGHEMGRMSTKFREMSLTGYESHNYPEWYSNRMCIQRIKASISGSAFKSKMWIEHNGTMMYWNLQEYRLMQKAHLFRENDCIYGMATTDVNDVNYVFDEDGKPVQSGDGILEQIDGSLKRNYTLEPDGTISIDYIDDLLQDCKLMAGSDGVIEVVMAGGQAATGAFERTMRNIYKYEPSMITKKTSAGLEVGADFVAYYHNGVRMIPLQCSAFDAPNLPSTYNSLTGRRNESYRMMALNTGIVDGGDNNIEMVTLGNGMGNRAFTKKYINGMESAVGDTNLASTSLDGLAIQVLMETGVLVRNPFTCGMLELFDSRS